MRHLTVQALLDQIEKKEVSFDVAAAEAHFKSCEQCRKKAEEFRGLLTFLAEDAGNEPPPELVDWGIQLFQPVLQPSESKASKVRRIAKRVFDSFEEPAPAGTRQVGTPSRHLLYRSDDVDVDVRIEPLPGEGRVSLAGQLVSESPRSFQRAPVQLESDGVVRYKTETNRVGEFSFDEVPEDTYHLSVDLPDGVLTLFCVYRGDLDAP